jgi:hypothetical protein
MGNQLSLFALIRHECGATHVCEDGRRLFCTQPLGHYGVHYDKDAQMHFKPEHWPHEDREAVWRKGEP